jgi:hypothetical protein
MNFGGDLLDSSAMHPKLGPIVHDSIVIHDDLNVIPWGTELHSLLQLFQILCELWSIVACLCDQITARVTPTSIESASGVSITPTPFTVMVRVRCSVEIIAC